jgi:hypothetical protein
MIPNLPIHYSLLIITIESLDKAAWPGRETVMIPSDLSSPVIPLTNYFCRFLTFCGFCIDDSNKIKYIIIQLQREHLDFSITFQSPFPTCHKGWRVPGPPILRRMYCPHLRSRRLLTLMCSVFHIWD